jgi:alkylation response protein AidB-like acyl-CoA dehydrogenase
MDFTFSEDQQTLRDTVRSVFMKEVAPELLRELWDSASGRSPQLWKLLTELGLTGLSVPEAYGGLGLSDLDWVLMAQEVGYYGLPEPLLDTAWLGAALIAALPAEASAFKDSWLTRIAYGEAKVAVGHPINPLVADAHVADLLLLAHDGEVHALTPEQVKLTAHASLDPSRRLFAVDWTPSAATRVADAGAGALLWQSALDRGALAVAAQLSGLTSRILDLAIDYTAERKQFGKPIGSFQAVKHLLADVAVKLEFAKPVLFRAAHSLAEGDALTEVHVSHARLAMADTAQLATRNGMQVHGAMGYTWELDLQIFMKRIWALSAAWGDRGLHLARVAGHVFGDADALDPALTFAA